MAIEKGEKICANCTAFLCKVGAQRSASHMTGMCRMSGAVKFQTVKGDEWCRDGFVNKHNTPERAAAHGLVADAP